MFLLKWGMENAIKFDNARASNRTPKDTERVDCYLPRMLYHINAATPSSQAPPYLLSGASCYAYTQ